MKVMMKATGGGLGRHSEPTVGLVESQTGDQRRLNREGTQLKKFQNKGRHELGRAKIIFVKFLCVCIVLSSLQIPQQKFGVDFAAGICIGLAKPNKYTE